MTATAEAFNRGERETLPRTIGGRYGLSSKEFGPECVLAIFSELQAAQPKPRFTVGIYDDVTNLSLPLGENTLPAEAKLEALFYGLGSDGSVSATKTTSKSSATRPHGSPVAILSMTRRKRAASPSRICGSAKTDSFIVSDFAG